MSKRPQYENSIKKNQIECVKIPYKALPESTNTLLQNSQQPIPLAQRQGYRDESLSGCQNQPKDKSQPSQNNQSQRQETNQFKNQSQERPHLDYNICNNFMQQNQFQNNEQTKPKEQILQLNKESKISDVQNQRSNGNFNQNISKELQTIDLIQVVGNHNDIMSNKAQNKVKKQVFNKNLLDLKQNDCSQNSNSWQQRNDNQGDKQDQIQIKQNNKDRQLIEQLQKEKDELESQKQQNQITIQNLQEDNATLLQKNQKLTNMLKNFQSNQFNFKTHTLKQSELAKMEADGKNILKFVQNNKVEFQNGQQIEEKLNKKQLQLKQKILNEQIQLGNITQDTSQLESEVFQQYQQEQQNNQQLSKDILNLNSQIEEQIQQKQQLESQVQQYKQSEQQKNEQIENSISDLKSYIEKIFDEACQFNIQVQDQFKTNIQELQVQLNKNNEENQQTPEIINELNREFTKLKLFCLQQLQQLSNIITQESNSQSVNLQQKQQTDQSLKSDSILAQLIDLKNQLDLHMINTGQFHDLISTILSPPLPIVLVLGQIGVGKTKFVNKLFQKYKIQEFIPIRHNDLNCYFVDTVSFDFKSSIDKREAQIKLFQGLFQQYPNKVADIFIVVNFERTDMMKDKIQAVQRYFKKFTDKITIVVTNFHLSENIEEDKSHLQDKLKIFKAKDILFLGDNTYENDIIQAIRKIQCEQNEDQFYPLDLKDTFFEAENEEETQKILNGLNLQLLK